ncbi:MAG TPA: methyltransferase domain-containing protein [Armatimonadota bacterium]|nr:methyltransferase domain-containing protein [Armatimonadota bacterium]
MNAILNEMMQSWHLGPCTDASAQIPALLESLQAAGLLRASACAVLLGEQYHLGGAEDTRHMAQAVGIAAGDRVVDLACYVGGPARQLAREFGCQVVGVDISPMHIAIARELTELCGMCGVGAGFIPPTGGRDREAVSRLAASETLRQECHSEGVAATEESPTGAAQEVGDSSLALGMTTSRGAPELHDKVSFLCASADAVPMSDGSFTVAWSQGSFPSDLSWLTEIKRLLAPNGRLTFTATIRRHMEHGRFARDLQAGGGQAPSLPCPTEGPALLSLGEMADRVTGFGFRVISAEDISQWEIEHGWLPARRKLEEREEHYHQLMGEEWVRWAYESLDADIALWRSGAAGSGRIIAVKE